VWCRWRNSELVTHGWLMFVALAGSAGCTVSEKKEVSASELRDALTRRGYTVTTRGNDPEAAGASETSCLDVKTDGPTTESICVWRCATAEACAQAMRAIYAAPKGHTQIGSSQVERTVIVERDCKGPTCGQLHADVAKAQLRF